MALGLSWSVKTIAWSNCCSDLAGLWCWTKWQTCCCFLGSCWWSVVWVSNWLSSLLTWWQLHNLVVQVGNINLSSLNYICRQTSRHLLEGRNKSERMINWLIDCTFDCRCSVLLLLLWSDKGTRHQLPVSGAQLLLDAHHCECLSCSASLNDGVGWGSTHLQ